jgi:hypothetical protein
VSSIGRDPIASVCGSDKCWAMGRDLFASLNPMQTYELRVILEVYTTGIGVKPQPGPCAIYKTYHI